MIVTDILDDRYGLILRTAQKRLLENGSSSFVFNANEDEQQVQSFFGVMAGQHCSGLIYVPEARVDSVVCMGSRRCLRKENRLLKQMFRIC